MLPDLSEKLAPFMQAPRWWVAYSGGVDSHLLLALLAQLPQRPPLAVIHVDHQLQSDSGLWAAHCREQAEALQLEFVCETVTIDPQADKGVEEAAREARYQVFAGLLQPGEVLMMGHHQDDQIETLLLRLLRGSGQRGLAGMPFTRSVGKGVLCRPLLDLSRGDIEQLAQSLGLHWIEDPSNRSEQYDRNFLRHRLLPLLAERWPGYRQALTRTVALSEENAQLNEELAELDCHALSLSPLAPSLPIAALQVLSPGRQKNLLRYWLSARQLPLPSAVQLQAVLEEVMQAREDAEPLLAWPGVQVRRFRGELYAMPPLAPVDPQLRVAIKPGRCVQIAGVGRVSLQPSESLGQPATAQPRIRQASLQQASVDLRLRQGGERCHPAGRSASQTLKKLLQEYAVETWLRDRLPLLYVDGQLAAVADYWVCAEFAAAPDEPAYLLLWDRYCQ